MTDNHEVTLSLKEIYSGANLSPEEIRLMPKYLDDSLDFYDSRAYDKLYDYFAFDGPVLMPYGTAKARDGDPVNWIIDYFKVHNEQIMVGK